MEKLLPQNIEAEQGVLGCILIDPEAFPRVINFLKPEHFYRETHRIIYTSMLSLYQKKEPADYIMVCNELERTSKLEEVGSSYLTGLLNVVPTSGNVEWYGHIVEQKATYRSIIQACGQIAGEAYEEEEEVAKKAQERFFQIGQGRTGKPLSNHVDALNRYWSSLQELYEQNSHGVLTGVPTGYRLLNQLLGGFRPSKSYILAGRPGEGKTAVALNFAYEAIKRGCQVLFFSIEMDEDELMQRLLAVESKVDSMHLRDAKLDPDEWERVVDGMVHLQGLPGKLWTDDTPANHIDAMRAKAREAQATHGVDMIIVDYLQLAKAGNGQEYKAENRRLEVERVSRELKEMARELKVPVLSLAQMNRDVDSRANRVPQLSDLREAGGIEQDGDVVMFIYRDPVIPAEAPEYDITLIIAKHRNGAKGNVPMHFVGAHTRFYGIDIAPLQEEEE